MPPAVPPKSHFRKQRGPDILDQAEAFKSPFVGGSLMHLFVKPASGRSRFLRARHRASCGEQKAKFALHYSHVPGPQFVVLRLRRNLQTLPGEHRSANPDDAGRLDRRNLPLLLGTAPLPATGNLSWPIVVQVFSSEGAPWGLRSADTRSF